MVLALTLQSRALLTHCKHGKLLVLKNGGDALKLNETRAIGRAARDAGMGRSRLKP